MITYISRRLLLMIPTLIGITIMVFLIARLAPGRPGQMGFEGAMAAEEARAMAEWYEQRYGLDLPLHRQYFRWWKGMFFVNRNIPAWTHIAPGLPEEHDRARRSAGESEISPRQAGGYVPISVFRRPVARYYAASSDGQWYEITNLAFEPETYVQDDPQFGGRVGPGAEGGLVEEREGYAKPIHVFVADAAIERIESLNAVAGARLQRATALKPHEVPVRVWTLEGDPLYANPDDPQRPLRHRGGEWSVFEPNDPPDRWVVSTITAQEIQRALRRHLSALPQVRDGYAIPRHTLIAGRAEPAQRTYNPRDLQPFTITRLIESAPAGVWMTLPGEGQAVHLREMIDPVPYFVARGADGDWRRLIGPTRIEWPTVRYTRQSDPAFLERLETEVRETIPQFERPRQAPRQAILEGRFVGADRPIEDRLIRRYQHETEVFEVTLGESIAMRTTVMDELRRRLPVTIMINVIAFPIIYLIAIPTGMVMSVTRGKMFDRMVNAKMLALWSIPTVLSATLLIGYTARGGVGVEWFPTGGLSSAGADAMPFFGYWNEEGEWVQGWLPDRIHHLVLPILCIVYGGFAYLAKQMRAAMLENFTMDYVRTAKAKGVGLREIVLQHVLRNSLLPIITIFATILPALIAGSIIIETIFNIPGMGQMAFRGVQNRDYDVVQAIALIAGTLNLIGLLLADICYAIADPRITYK